MNTFIQIVVSSMDWMKANRYILSTSNRFSLPVAKLIPEREDQEPEDLAREVFSNFVDLDPAWATVRILSAKRHSDDLLITYGIVIPYDSRLKEGKWLNADSVDPNHLNRDEIHNTIGMI